MSHEATGTRRRPDSISKLDDHSIFRYRKLNLCSACQHLLTEVGQDEPFAPEAAPVVPDALIAHMIERLPIEVAALAEKEIHSLGMGDKRLGPGRISGIEELFSLVTELKPQRDLPHLMRHAKRKDADAPDGLFSVWLQDMKARRRQWPGVRGLTKHDLEQGACPLLGAWRAGHLQRLDARIFVESIQEKKGQATEVVAVEMAQKHDIQLPRVEARPLHSEQRRGPAVQEKEPIPRIDEVAAVVSASAPEGITATEDVKFHKVRGL